MLVIMLLSIKNVGIHYSAYPSILGNELVYGVKEFIPQSQEQNELMAVLIVGTVNMLRINQ